MWRRVVFGGDADLRASFLSDFPALSWSPKLLLRETYTIRVGRENAGWESRRF